jgi:acyl-CoA thioesterase
VGKTSAFPKHLGMEILDLQPGRSLIRLPVGAHLKNSSGAMQGGAIASLVDSAGGLAARPLTHPETPATV